MNQLPNPKSRPIPSQDCVACGYRIDMANGKDLPCPGDFSVCFNCGHPSKYNEQMQCEDLSPEDLIELNDKSPEDFDHLQRAMKMIRDRGLFQPRRKIPLPSNHNSHQHG